jgi:hypothetical protein
MARTGVGVRQPWQRKKFAVSMKKTEREMAAEDSRIKSLIRSPFIGRISEGGQQLEGSRLDSRANGQILPRMVKLPSFKS